MVERRVETLVLSRALTQLGTLFQAQLRKIIVFSIAIVVAYLVLPPLAVLLFSVVRSTQDKLPFEATSFTLDNIVNVFSSPVTYQLLANTAWYTTGSVALGLSISIGLAWFLERSNMPFRRFFFTMTLLPMGIPGIVFGMAWIQLANPTNGLFNVALRGLFGLDSPGPLNIYSIPGMVLITAMRMVPIMYLMISGVFARIDPSLEEAGSTSGARSWKTFRRISMPLLAPALLAAVIYFMIIGIEAFEIPALLGFPARIFVFSSAIYYVIHPVSGLPDFGLAATYGLVLLAAALVLIYAYRRYIRRTDRFATVTGRGYRPRLIDLGRWRYAPPLVLSLYFVFAVLMPVLALLWRSLAPPFADVSFESVRLFSLDTYRAMVRFPGIVLAAKNTLLIATATACIAMVLVTLLSWLSVRRRAGRVAGFSEYLSFVILGVPGVVLALALIFLYASMPVPLYGTIWVIVIGLVTLCLPFGTRLMTAAMLQIHRELEEAAETSGVKLLPTLTRIVLPLLWPSFVRGFLWTFVRGTGDATVALMLQAFGSQTVTVVLWGIWMTSGDLPLASTIAVPLVIFSSVLAFFVGRNTMLAGGNV